MGHITLLCYYRTILGDYMARVRDSLNPHYDEVSSVVFKMRER